MLGFCHYVPHDRFLSTVQYHQVRNEKSHYQLFFFVFEKVSEVGAGDDWGTIFPKDKFKGSSGETEGRWKKYHHAIIFGVQENKM